MNHIPASPPPAPTVPLLVAAAELHDLLRAAAPPVVLDCSFDLADPTAGERAYALAHVPTAFYAHLDRDLSTAKTGTNGRHPLPARDAFAATAARWGIDPASHVVVYDRQGAPYAARAWWMLRWIGVARVSVLDGGWAAWGAAGLPQETEPREPVAEDARPAWRPAPVPGMPSVNASQLLQRLNRLPLIDARAGERYRGEKEPLDPVAGRIPGALNRPFTQNLGPDGRFASPQDLRAAFAPLLGGHAPAEAVHQCGSGVTACHNLLAMEIAGLPGSQLYPGSWSEWCADPARPVARG
jgi:thiosulfate/3-mercaptopyruvate sulfurtransferase